MTGMEHAIDTLAFELFERSHEPSFSDDAQGMREAREWAKSIVRDLSDAWSESGLLAPAPLREEWACRYKRRSGEVIQRGEGSEADARSWATDEGDQIVRRLVSDWLPVDRAEGDGRAEQ